MSPDMASGTVSPEPVTPDPSVTAMLLTFFTISDIHICDKESPARCIEYAYQYPNPSIPVYGPVGNTSAYSGIILYTTQVLDAAVQTINAVHQVSPFDFGISLGDACDNTQYNETQMVYRCPGRQDDPPQFRRSQGSPLTLIIRNHIRRPGSTSRSRGTSASATTISPGWDLPSRPITSERPSSDPTSSTWVW